MKKAAVIALGLIAVLAGGAVFIYLAFTGPGEIPPATVDFRNLSEKDRQQLIERGRYLARAGDCVACHKSPDGLALAGGLSMETPFGTLYGTNVTPSIAHGIGNWSANDLYRAMVWGINPDGSHLYPAMPYTSYHYTTRADVDALWMYLMAQRAIDKPNRAHELTFPFNLRPLLGFWNLLFRPDDRELRQVAGKSEQWHRGRYLVDVLGHCGECHTPRNLAYAKKTDEHLKGEVIEHALAPDISPNGLTRRGWTPKDLASFMKIGIAPQGTMTFRMFPVLNHSTKYLTDDDIAAMVAYLFDDKVGRETTTVATAPQPATTGTVANAAMGQGTETEQGRRLYIGLCAGCHGTEGEGRPHASVPLNTNTTAMLDNPLNLIRIIREGVPEHRLANDERMQAMPGFADRLSHSETAQLVNYLRTRWGDLPANVSSQQVEKIVSKHGRRDRND